MKTQKTSRTGITLIWILSSALASFSASAELLLNGLSTSSELGKERFVAGLYTDRLSSDANDLLGLDGERRMELKITASRFSARNLNSMWIQGMAINNPDSVLQQQGENITQFSNMIRKALVEGDVLVLDAAPGKGLTVTLNDTELGNIESDEFFSVLLRSWIGNVPLSSEFKEELLAEGKVDSSLSGRYSAIAPSATRIQTVANWVTPQAAPPPPPVTVARAPTPTVSRPAITLPNQPALRPSEIATPAIEAIRENPERIASALPSQRATDADKDQSTAASAPAAIEANNPNTNAPTQTPSTTASTPAPAPVTAPNQVAVASQTPTAQPLDAIEDDEEEEALFTMEAILGQTRYINEVVRHATKFQEYPAAAARRNQQGNVRLSITVDRSGNVVDVQTIEESRYRALNKEALSLVEKASPFPEVPAGVGSETYTFSLPVVFRLQ